MAPPDDDLDSTSTEPELHRGVAEPPSDNTLPILPHRGTPLWRRLVALIGLAGFSVLGGLVIALTVAALVATAAVVLQLVIS